MVSLRKNDKNPSDYLAGGGRLDFFDLIDLLGLFHVVIYKLAN